MGVTAATSEWATVVQKLAQLNREESFAKTAGVRSPMSPSGKMPKDTANRIKERIRAVIQRLLSSYVRHLITRCAKTLRQVSPYRDASTPVDRTGTDG
ncbi:unnamed protein product [Peronospora belbahrii]|nr:unnamed protein product [Peronospora belbahrii]